MKVLQNETFISGNNTADSDEGLLDTFRLVIFTLTSFKIYFDRSNIKTSVGYLPDWDICNGLVGIRYSDFVAQLQRCKIRVISYSLTNAFIHPFIAISHFLVFVHGHLSM